MTLSPFSTRGGTNARIFYAQCRVLSTLLNPHFRLCFAEAPVPSQPGPDVVSVYRHFGDFKSWIPMPLDPSISPTIVAEKIIKSLRHTREDDVQVQMGSGFVCLDSVRPPDQLLVCSSRNGSEGLGWSKCMVKSSFASLSCLPGGAR